MVPPSTGRAAACPFAQVPHPLGRDAPSVRSGQCRPAFPLGPQRILRQDRL